MQQLTVLNLNSNSIGDDGVYNLARYVNNIEKLHLWNCDITERGIEALSKRINSRSSPVITLIELFQT